MIGLGFSQIWLNPFPFFFFFFFFFFSFSFSFSFSLGLTGCGFGFGSDPRTRYQVFFPPSRGFRLFISRSPLSPLFSPSSPPKPTPPAGPPAPSFSSGQICGLLPLGHSLSFSLSFSFFLLCFRRDPSLRPSPRLSSSPPAGSTASSLSFPPLLSLSSFFFFYFHRNPDFRPTETLLFFLFLPLQAAGETRLPPIYQPRWSFPPGAPAEGKASPSSLRSNAGEGKGSEMGRDPAINESLHPLRPRQGMAGGDEASRSGEFFFSFFLSFFFFFSSVLPSGTTTPCRRRGGGPAGAGGPVAASVVVPARYGGLGCPPRTPRYPRPRPRCPVRQQAEPGWVRSGWSRPVSPARPRDCGFFSLSCAGLLPSMSLLTQRGRAPHRGVSPCFIILLTGSPYLVLVGCSRAVLPPW